MRRFYNIFELLGLGKKFNKNLRRKNRLFREV